MIVLEMESQRMLPGMPKPKGEEMKNEFWLDEPAARTIQALYELPDVEDDIDFLAERILRLEDTLLVQARPRVIDDEDEYRPVTPWHKDVSQDTGIYWNIRKDVDGYTIVAVLSPEDFEDSWEIVTELDIDEDLREERADEPEKSKEEMVQVSKQQLFAWMRLALSTQTDATFQLTRDMLDVLEGKESDQ